MSDTQGAESIDDQATTASGGLVNDMPGLPVSPPSQGQGRPPSPLSALASMAMGSPPPQSAQPGRSPWQSPGQSQIPNMPGQGNTVPPARRWQDTTASLALPRGIPQPRARFTPFIPSPPTTSHEQWGQDEPYPNLPQPFETPSLYQNTSKFFGENGSAAIIPLALSMGKNAGAFLEGVQKGQEWKAKMHRQQMEDDAFELEQRQKQQMTAYADTVYEYTAAAGVGRASDVGNYAIKGQTMIDALASEAYKLGDDKLLAVLGTGSAEKAIQFINERNDHLLNLTKANATTEKQRGEDEMWGLTPPSQTGGTSDPMRPQAPSDPMRPQQTAQRGAAPQGAPATQPAQGEDLIGDGAQQIFKGIEPGGYIPPDVKNAMAVRAAQMRAAANKILQNPNIKPDQVMPEVERQLGSTVAADLKGYSQYRAGPGATGQASGGKEQDYWNLLGDLAQKALPGDPQSGKPGWNKSTYQAVRDFREGAQKPNSPIQRIPTSVEAAKNVLNDLKAIQQRDGSSADVSPETISGAAGKDPLYAQLNIDWIRYNEDIDVLTRGTPSVGMAEQAIGTMPQVPYFGSIQGYRAAVRRDMDQAKSRVDQLHGTWNQYQTGDIMPGYNKQAEEDMTNIGKIDYVTGARPGEIVTHPDGTKFKYLGVNPENPGARENWQVAQ